MAPRKNQSMSKKISFFQQIFFLTYKKGDILHRKKIIKIFSFLLATQKIHLNSLTCVFLASKGYQEIRQLSTESGGRHGYKKNLYLKIIDYIIEVFGKERIIDKKSWNSYTIQYSISTDSFELAAPL